MLHHAARPELVISELARVTRPGGRLLIVDQLGATTRSSQLERDRFERVRDPSHQRSLPDADIRALLEMNDLVVLRDEIVTEERELDPYLDRAGLSGEKRERARRARSRAELEGRGRLVPRAKARRLDQIRAAGSRGGRRRARRALAAAPVRSRAGDTGTRAP